jgi:hypothetical protein
VLDEITLCETDHGKVMSGEGILPSNVKNLALLEKLHFTGEPCMLIR